MMVNNQISFGWKRGVYQELRLDIPENIEEYQKAAAELAKKQWEDVRVIVWEAQRRGLLPVEYKDWDSKGRGESISLDLYGFSPTIGPKLVLVQVRRTYRYAIKHFLTVKKDYFVTDGEKAIKVPGQVVKMAVKIDPDVDSPLRAVKRRLPFDWQLLVAQELRMPAPPQTGWRVAYKAMRLDDDGTLRSLYLPSFVYKLGKLYSEKVRPDHGGGFYVYSTIEETLRFAREWGKKFGAERIAIVRCMVRGGPIEYDLGKMAFSQLRPLEILKVLEL